MALDVAALLGRTLVAADLRAELIARGWQEAGFCELANLEKQDWVRDIAEAFLDAGVDVLITPTDSANTLARYERPKTGRLAPDRAAEICRRGAEILRQTVGEFPAN